MWCTRWFLPLLLLPLPIAPPYFLVVFLFSLTLHAKPCFYCIILLTALFVSSCYWQPFPITNSLSTPWSTNITTFADALNASLSDTETPLPSVMRVADRCWCDFSTGNIFESFNVSNWEHVSVERMKENLVRQGTIEKGTELAGNDTADEDPNLTSPDSPQTISAKPPTTSVISSKNWLPILNLFHGKSQPSLRGHPPLEDSKSPPPEQPTVETTKTSASPALLNTNENIPFLRREYDLRAYGLDMIIDFGWTRIAGKVDMA